MNEPESVLLSCFITTENGQTSLYFSLFSDCSTRTCICTAVTYYYLCVNLQTFLTTIQCSQAIGAWLGSSVVLVILSIFRFFKLVCCWGLWTVRRSCIADCFQVAVHELVSVLQSRFNNGDSTTTTDINWSIAVITLKLFLFLCIFIHVIISVLRYAYNISVDVSMIAILGSSVLLVTL